MRGWIAIALFALSFTANAGGLVINGITLGVPLPEVIHKQLRSEMFYDIVYMGMPVHATVLYDNELVRSVSFNVPPGELDDIEDALVRQYGKADHANPGVARWTVGDSTIILFRGSQREAPVLAFAYVPQAKQAGKD